jgi:hypothetical protein
MRDRCDAVASPQYRDGVEPAAGSHGQAAATPFAVTYPRLWQELRGLEWAAYTTGTPVDRSALDRRIFESASDPAGLPPGHADGPLVERIRRRALVDHHPDVVRLRDRLDNWSAYGLQGGPPTPTGRRDLAAAMEPDLVTLIRLRDGLARDLGASSYGHLAMEAEGLDLDAVAEAMTRARSAGLDETAALVAREGLTTQTWVDGLDRVAGPSRFDAIVAAHEVADRLGCGDHLARVRVRVADGPLAGWTAAVSIPDDVRLLVRPARSLRELAIVLHETGHALAYAGTRAHGVRAVPGETQDEVMGMVLERIGTDLLLAADERSRLDRVVVAETTRLATSALFELSIQDDPAHARERYLDWYRPLVGVADPVEWALDSFRSSDPFRVHAYVLGEAFAGRLVDWLHARLVDDAPAWGSWLRETLWAPGRRDTIEELVTL